jgi:hypothetical protein
MIIPRKPTIVPIIFAGDRCSSRKKTAKIKTHMGEEAVSTAATLLVCDTSPMVFKVKVVAVSNP